MKPEGPTVRVWVLPDSDPIFEGVPELSYVMRADDRSTIHVRASEWSQIEPMLRELGAVEPYRPQ